MERGGQQPFNLAHYQSNFQTHGALPSYSRTNGRTITLYSFDVNGAAFPGHERPLDWVAVIPSPGRKYAPHIARMIFNNLLPKLDVLKARQPHHAPRTDKQSHASTYRVAQMYIHAQWGMYLKGFLHRLIWPHGIADPRPKPTDVSLLDFKAFHNLLYLHGIIDDNFLKGVEASANSTDFVTLWVAGWDEDLFVLLLCYVLLSPNLNRPNIGWLPRSAGRLSAALTQISSRTESARKRRRSA